MKDQQCQGLAPFSGLGFDLGAVALRAGGLKARRAALPRTRPEAPGRFLPPPTAWGYGLMLALGRETGGS